MGALRGSRLTPQPLAGGSAQLQMGASMHFSRFRVGVIATAGTAAVLSLPVVATGQVPSVGGVVGGVTDQLPSLPVPSVPAPALPAPLPAPPPQAPAPAPAPTAPAPTVPAPSPSLPSAPSVAELPNTGGNAPAPAGSAPGSSTPATGRSAPSVATTAEGSRKSADTGSSRSSRHRDGGAKAKGSNDEPAGASGDESPAKADAALASAAVQADPADLPDNPSPDTAPFTGLQLAYMVAMGLMLAAAGMTFRRMARR
jgi:hypothetical protein